MCEVVTLTVPDQNIVPGKQYSIQGNPELTTEAKLIIMRVRDVRCEVFTPISE